MAHLYVMSRSDAPGLFKVGKSNDPLRRAKQLQAGHAFWVNVEATFTGHGGLELQVHQILQPTRVDGAGREWFRTGLHVVLAAIAQSIQSGGTKHHSPVADPTAVASQCAQSHDGHSPVATDCNVDDS